MYMRAHTQGGEVKFAMTLHEHNAKTRSMKIEIESRIISKDNRELEINGRLKNYQQVMLPGVLGPESIAFDCHGKGPYVGVSDGRILKWQGHPLGWIEFAITSSNRNN
ncbi:hypothetical protein Dsin_009728 [Dipteronia sinensis]|uniref:Uncharacterized protein n=1 Tax=Dipteronia sinensis TaxID=43782 RepID=A0AAE0AR46_9ROSI|nr:hypothetical protein Dsin_009728 [Dipteronia sinensis]